MFERVEIEHLKVNIGEIDFNILKSVDCIVLLFFLDCVWTTVEHSTKYIYLYNSNFQIIWQTHYFVLLSTATEKLNEIENLIT